MTNKIYLKRNTTPAIPIRVNGVDFNKLDKVILGFKACKHNNTPLLLKKTIMKESGVFKDTSSSGFTVVVTLTTKDTFELKPGDLFVDVYPIVGTAVINTGAPLRYEVIDTLLDEVITI